MVRAISARRSALSSPPRTSPSPPNIASPPTPPPRREDCHPAPPPPPLGRPLPPPGAAATLCCCVWISPRRTHGPFNGGDPPVPPSDVLQLANVVQRSKPQGEGSAVANASHAQPCANKVQSTPSNSSPPSSRTRLKAVNACPAVCSLRPLMTALERDWPWALWMVMANASVRGSCLVTQRPGAASPGAPPRLRVDAVGCSSVAWGWCPVCSQAHPQSYRSAVRSACSSPIGRRSRAAAGEVPGKPA